MEHLLGQNGFKSAFVTLPTETDARRILCIRLRREACQDGVKVQVLRKRLPENRQEPNKEGLRDREHATPMRQGPHLERGERPVVR